jgi:hypothetical protein
MFLVSFPYHLLDHAPERDMEFAHRLRIGLGVPTPFDAARNSCTRKM